MQMKYAGLLIAATLLLPASSALADDAADWMNDGAPQLPKGVVSSDMSMVSKDSSAFSLTVQATRQMKSDHPDQAIRLAHRALELDPDCAETHMVLATAYERKYKMGGESDPELYNSAVREWLSVLRNDYGEEKGTSFHGLSLPGVGGKFYEDEERHMPARNHILKLTGTTPKIWETNEKFMKRVQHAGETSVSAKLLKDGDKTSTAPATEVPANKTKSSAVKSAPMQ